MTTWLDFGASNALAATVLALVAWLVSRACSRPQVVFAVWVLVLAKLVTPPLVALPVESLRGRLDWTAPIASHEPTELPVSELLESDELPYHLRLPSEPLASAAIADPMEPLGGSLDLDEFDQLEESTAAPQFDEIQYRLPDPVSPGEAVPAAADPFTVTKLLLAVWLAGSSLWFALAAARIMRFRRLLKLARPAPEALVAEVGGLARRMELRKVPEVRVVRRRVSPLVWALGGRATLLLPSDLLRRLTRDERATLLAHELAHLKRRDHLVRLLELAALGLFWWHPVAWWARLNAERAAEHCCDAQVIELFPAQARAYALALWATVDFLSDAPEALPLGASGFSQARHVKRRMEMILANTRARRAGRPLRLLLLAIGLTVLPLSLRSLWAEPPAPATADTQQEEVEITPIDERLASEADSLGAVEIEETVTTSPSQGFAFYVGSQETEEQSGKPAPKTSSIEERLDRLEKMIQKLAESKAPEAAPAAKPKTFESTKQRTKDEKPRPEKAAIDDARSRWDELSSWKLFKEANPDLKSDTSGQLADIVKRATMHLEMSKTNLARFEAAKQQAEAVSKAYEDNAASLDQLLEAQRRVVEAYLTYVHATAELEPKALERQLVVATAGLAAMNDALNDARKTWKKTHAAYLDGGEAKGEAQAREQYYQFKTQLEKQLGDYKRAEAAFKQRASEPKWRSEAAGESQEEMSDVKAKHKLAAEKVDKLGQAKLKAAADDMKRRMADAEKIQVRAKLEIEKARREADEARWKLEGLEKHAKLRQQEAEAAAKVGEAAAKQLEAIKAAADAAKEAAKSDAPK